MKDFGPEDATIASNTSMQSGLNVTEDVAIAFSNAFLEIEIWDTNRETLEETFQDKIRLDISCMLQSGDGVDVSSHSFFCLLCLIL